MKIQLIAAVCCACVLLAGCGQTEELDSMGENLKMSMVASIEGSDNSGISRYAGGTPIEASFSDGDDIGLAVGDGDFVKWTLNGTNWSPEGNTIYWEDRNTEYAFCAFYPYAENASKGNVPMPALTSQDGTMESVAECDFLVATKSQKYGTNGIVELTGDYAFTHESSLVAMTVKAGGDLTSATLDKITIEGEGVVSASTYSFIDKKVTVSNDENDALIVSFTNKNMTSSGETFYFILNSETVELTDVTLSIEYTSGGIKYEAEKVGIQKDDGDDKFNSGKQYVYSVTVVDQTLKITGNDIKDWETGDSLGEIVIGGEKV